MTKRLKLFLIAAFALISSVCLFAGCKLTNSVDDIVNANNLKAQVTYFANGGVFSDNMTDPVKTLYYPAGVKPLDVGSSDNRGGSMGDTYFIKGSFTVDYANYNFSGWYKVRVNSDGNALYTDGSVFDKSVGLEDGKEIDVTDEQYLFDELLEENDHIYICAKWYADVKIRVMLASDDPALEITVGDSAVGVGEELRTYDFTTSSVNEPKEVKYDGVSFIHYYEDENCEKLFEGWPIQRGEEDVVLYAMYIRNEDNKPWYVIHDSSDVRTMFSLKGENNYYFIKDTDCTGVSVAPIDVTFKIKGNGYTIDNLSVKTTAVNGNVVSLFGNITASAAITDLTIDNLVCDYSVRMNAICEIYVVYRSLSDDAEISNVTVNATLKVTLGNGSIVENMSGGDLTHYLFGGKTSDADHDGNGFTVNATYTEN